MAEPNRYDCFYMVVVFVSPVKHIGMQGSVSLVSLCLSVSPVTHFLVSMPFLVVICSCICLYLLIYYYETS